ncbi:DUF6343 family protein [Saccharothrix sp. ALI-22-I]|uniref:DUF6343 family protein n=1 Tax=Saccharothrix sp. ALI-22-I TaxID=1933778 RepID=UPI0015C301B7|nr:DUF6343 family protein [Saccharothrix sp. ALI-22-I]
MTAPGYPDDDDLPPRAPPRSALTLRLWLAGFGIVFNGVAAVLCVRAGLTWLAVLLAVIVVALVVDFGWVVHRKRRGDPG